jgi:hypothetical protein
MFMLIIIKYVNLASSQPVSGINSGQDNFIDHCVSKLCHWNRTVVGGGGQKRYCPDLSQCMSVDNYNVLLV